MKIRERLEQHKMDFLAWALPRALAVILPRAKVASKVSSPPLRAEPSEGRRHAACCSGEIPPGKGFTVVRENVYCDFKGEKLVVTEMVDGEMVEGATSIIACFIGEAMQLQVGTPSGIGVPSNVFKSNVMDNELTFAMCRAGGEIVFWVRNDRDVPVKWSATLLGHEIKS